MLFIFRKLRRSFFLPGKVRTYVAYALGEIALIVVGILIAVQIGEWNSQRKDYAEETQILLRLKPEFERNQADLERLIRSNQRVSADMEALVKVIKPDPESHPEDLIFGYLGSLGQNRRYTPESGEISSIINSGKTALISNPELSIALNKWPRRVEAIEKIFELMFTQMNRFPANFEYFRKMDLDYYSRPEYIGKSDFPSDLNKVLSSPVMEDMAATRLRWANLLIVNFEGTLVQQQEILDLIDAELVERGADEN